MTYCDCKKNDLTGFISRSNWFNEDISWITKKKKKTAEWSYNLYWNQFSNANSKGSWILPFEEQQSQVSSSSSFIFSFLLYRIHLKGYSGTAGKISSIGQPGSDFSTKDADNDKCVCKCSQLTTGGKKLVYTKSFWFSVTTKKSKKFLCLL